MDRHFLDDVYRDFFGNAPKPDPKASKPDPEASKPDPETLKSDPEASKPDPEASKPDPETLKSDPEDALRRAEEALAEASKVFGTVNSSFEEHVDFLTQSLDRLEKEYGDGFVQREREAFLRAAGELPEAPAGAEGAPAGGEASAEGMTASTGDVKAAQEAAEEPEEDPMEQLMALTGLSTIKHDVRELTDFVSVQKMRKDQGLKSVPVSLHLVFTGNPGTGKTTVARIIGKIYKKIGVLSKGQLIETDRSGLVAGYVGQTAIKTQERIAEALGGVLFIDEAYSLAQKDDAFGQEAIDTLLKAMEDHRDDFVIVVAGYTKPMEKFINSNPGLKSRFNKYIEFPDYTVDELEAIFFSNCDKYDYVMEDEAKKHVREMIVQAKLAASENFANAREVRNLFEKIITNQARRIRTMEDPSHEDMMTLMMEDLTDPEENAAAPEDEETT